MAVTDKMDEDRLCSIVAGMVEDAEAYRNERSVDREKAMEYYDGKMEDVPADEGRSRVVSRDVRSAVRKVLPSVLRTILGNDEIVEYTPIGEGDEEIASQASDYVNYIAIPECGGRQQIEDAINDALRLRNGIIKWWVESKIEIKTSMHTGLDEMAFAQLVSDDDVEVLEHTERTEQIEFEGQLIEIPAHDVRIKRRLMKSLPRIGAVAPENFLIHSEAIRLADSPITGEVIQLRRSDLVAMGYDREKIDKLSASDAGSSEQENEEAARRRDVFNQETAASKAMEEIDYYDLLVRVDYDDDGIAELRRMVFAGGLKAENLLENEEWDEVNYADIVSERRPHQWEGNSIADEVMDIQTINTVLARQTMDNLYWQNNLQPTVQEGSILNPESVTNPGFGEPIRVKEGMDSRTAVSYNPVPFVADKSFAMIEFWKREATDRTGISDASSGMAPDALQNMTAKASAMIEAAGIGQAEMMVRCVAESLKPVFRGLLKLIIQHQDKPRTVRLRDEWVTFDPRYWNADMDAIVNVGLGAGTRERDMMMLSIIADRQEKILASMGPTVGRLFVSVDNLNNTNAKFVEAIGMKTPQLYFRQPTEDEVQEAIESQRQQPTDAQIRAETAIAVEDKRTEREMLKISTGLQAKREELAAKMEADASKEDAQMQADLITKLQEIEAEASARMEEAVLRATTDRERHEVDLQKAGMTQQTEREWMDTQKDIAAAKIISDQQKAQAANIGRVIDRQRAPDGNRAGRNGR